MLINDDALWPIRRQAVIKINADFSSITKQGSYSVENYEN